MPNALVVVRVIHQVMHIFIAPVTNGGFVPVVLRKESIQMDAIQKNVPNVKRNLWNHTNFTVQTLTTKIVQTVTHQLDLIAFIGIVNLAKLMDIVILAHWMENADQRDDLICLWFLNKDFFD